ncbi:MAG: hypothetical protein MUF31_16150 [Akkermansiaceae bacterium]|jgi:hypothetical protein|nr:hypothetical protein [Akkermansiaceae bacterium]
MKWIDLLVPRISVASWGRLGLAAAAGALVAGAYGILHDQLTYTLGPEYFTRFKFLQFDWANRGQPLRLYVAEIGFHATWWVGAICAWTLGRLTRGPDREVRQAREILRGFPLILGISALAGVCGLAYGQYRLDHGGLHYWEPFRDAYGITDLEAFARVGYIHNFGYAGAVIGLIVAIIIGRRFST